MLAITAPVSFIAQSIAKYAFGRVTTRVWLLAPNEYGFHWFSGEDRSTDRQIRRRLAYLSRLGTTTMPDSVTV